MRLGAGRWTRARVAASDVTRGVFLASFAGGFKAGVVRGTSTCLNMAGPGGTRAYVWSQTLADVQVVSGALFVLQTYPDTRGLQGGGNRCEVWPACVAGGLRESTLSRASVLFRRCTSQNTTQRPEHRAGVPVRKKFLRNEQGEPVQGRGKEGARSEERSDMAAASVPRTFLCLASAVSSSRHQR